MTPDNPHNKEYYLPRVFSGEIEWDHSYPPSFPGGISQAIKKTHREWEKPKSALRDALTKILYDEL